MRNSWMGRLAAVSLLVGCSESPTACTPQTTTVEIVWGGAFENIQRQQVRDMEADGWACTSQALRNALGGEYGVKYTCTVCQ